ncbi:hypothetical protein GCM10007939_02150 [Amylibacter marinus]|uniref:Phage abortive infection protein n=1 Tax=Amylibacter marinus TaxID=1475483 RepID=A0ABQ5VS22_9RHOB|nr:hypothetical protein [Amylibacter marinus]GLQ33932.1 hypothetical protein GCM10007939_02150 [Amylibacter marinus]
MSITADQSTEHKFWELGNPVMWGVIATILVAILAGVLGFLQVCDSGHSFVEHCETNAMRFLNSPPNEVGDTLAGFAGALAFIWIIVTVGLQSKELAAQREELKLTRDEFSKMAASQSQQVDILKIQGDIFLDEQRQRKEAEQKDFLDELLLRLKGRMEIHIYIGKGGHKKILFEQTYQKLGPVDIYTTLHYSDLSIDEYFARRVRELYHFVNSDFSKSIIIEDDNIRRWLVDLRSMLKQVNSIEGLSHTQESRISRLTSGEIFDQSLEVLLEKVQTP